MDRRRVGLRALHLLPLIVYSQVPIASASPFTALNPSTSEPPDPNCTPNERKPALEWRSVSGIDYTTSPSIPSYSSESWQPEVYQILDGQIQAPYPASVDGIPATGSGTTTTSKTGSTTSHPHTPVPRDWTTSTLPTISFPSTSLSGAYSSSSGGSPTLATRQNTPLSISTSTTTVFVVPSPPSRSPVDVSTTSTTQSVAESFSTTIPDSSLTFLTTSEVQTVTAPGPTNTTGVSISFPPLILLCGGFAVQKSKMARHGETWDHRSRVLNFRAIRWSADLSSEKYCARFERVSSKKYQTNNYSYHRMSKPRLRRLATPLPSLSQLHL